MQNSTSFIRILNCFLALALVTGPQLAFAQDRDWDHRLRGDYVFTQRNICVDTVPGGFDRDTLELLEDGEVTSFTSRGVTSFDGNGGMRVNDGEVTVIFQDQTSAGDTPFVGPSPFSCEGTYSVEQDLGFEMTFDCVGEVPPFLETGPATLKGQISRYGQTLIFTGNEPVIEELSIPGVGVVAERVCTAIATDIRAQRVR